MMSPRRTLISLAVGGLVIFVGLNVHQVSAQSSQMVPSTTNVVPVTSGPATIIQPDAAIGNPDAPDQITLTAIPPRLGDDNTLTGKPGEKIQATIQVRNSSAEPMTVESIVQDFVVGADGKTPEPVDSETSNRWSLASWVEVFPATQVVQPRQTANVNLVITVPPDALPGGHYAMVLHEPMKNAMTDDQGNLVVDDTAARIAQRVGSLLYFVVDGPVNEEAFIRNVTFPKLTEKGPVPFTFEVENLSDIHIKPQVTVDIYNVFGQKVDSIVIESQNVFPFVSRQFEGQWNRVWGIGPYQAKLTMSYGTQGRIAMAASSFWLIPLTYVWAAIAVIAIVAIIILLIIRFIKKRQGSEKARVKALEDRLHELEKENKHSSRD